mgnify:CR=1 FL=1
MLPIVLVYQPQTMKVIESNDSESLNEWEKRISEWAGMKFDSSSILARGGTCCDSGNDCDQD